MQSAKPKTQTLLMGWSPVDLTLTLQWHDAPDDSLCAEYCQSGRRLMIPGLQV